MSVVSVRRVTARGAYAFLGLGIAIGSMVCRDAAAQSAEEFYADRQLTMMVSSNPGGGYDAFARTVARHMAKHLPKGARFIVKNVPGATGVVLANRMTSVIEPDGATVALIHREAVFEPLFSRDSNQIKYDPRKLIWLGSPNLEVGMLYMSTASGIDSIEDAKRKETFLAASGGARSVGVTMPKILNVLLGTRFKVITGYPSSLDAILAMEKGEAGGRLSPGWSGPEPARVNKLVSEGKARLIMYLSAKKSPDYPSLPNVMDFIKPKEDRQIMTLLLATQSMGRPFFVPPKVPADRVALLRKAFAATMKDPEFVTDATKQKLTVAPISASDMNEIVAEAYAVPQAVLRRALDLLAQAQKK